MKCLDRKSQKKSFTTSPSTLPTVGRSNEKGLGIWTTFSCLPRSLRYRNVRRSAWSTATAVARMLSVRSTSCALSASACFFRSSKSPTEPPWDSGCPGRILTYHPRGNQKPEPYSISDEGHPRLRPGHHQLPRDRLRA